MIFTVTAVSFADNLFALEREHHDDGEQQRDQGDGADSGDEPRVIPVLVLDSDQHQARHHAAKEGDAEVDRDALGDLENRDIDRHAFEAEPGGQDGDEQVGINQ